MEQVCDLEAVQLQEILVKVCVVFYNKEICYRGCEERVSFLAIIFDFPKSVVVGLSMVEGLFSLLFICESGMKQYAVPKTLTDDFR